MIYVLPAIIAFILVFGIIKKVPLYDAFSAGVKKSFPLVVKIFPFIVTVLIMCEVFEQSGLKVAIIDLLTPFFNFFGVDERLIGLILIKPFSGSGSLALFSEIINENGADSYISRCACVLFGSSETIFYVGAVYFSSRKKTDLILPIVISLAATFISTVFAVFICRIL